MFYTNAKEWRNSCTKGVLNWENPSSRSSRLVWGYLAGRLSKAEAGAERQAEDQVVAGLTLNVAVRMACRSAVVRVGGLRWGMGQECGGGGGSQGSNGTR